MKATVVNESINKSGRNVQVRYTSDDPSINQFLDLPTTWSKTFPINTKPGKMKQFFINDITSSINSAKQAIANNALIGREFTVTI